MEWPGTLAVAHSYLKHRAGELMRYCIKKVLKQYTVYIFERNWKEWVDATDSRDLKTCMQAESQIVNKFEFNTFVCGNTT